ncbi:MAG: hypothetical protein EGP82_00105 [Odoribacter splanchnicus]|nr:hypothetical protein [Odoribacter splanchnicus]
MELPVSLLAASIKRGSILHSTIFENIDHGKFFVIIGITEEYIAGFFFINSNIHKSLWGKQEQLAMQYPLKHTDYTFLEYDSFLCATDILKREKEELVKSISEGVTSIIGYLQEDHLQEILEMVRQSKLFSNKDKRDFFYKE